METVQIIKNLKKYSNKYIENETRELIDINKFTKDDYSYGFIINMIDNEYEVYMFVASDTEDVIASNLLHKDFRYLDQAKDYFNKLISEYSNLSLDVLYTKF